MRIFSFFLVVCYTQLVKELPLVVDVVNDTGVPLAVVEEEGDFVAGLVLLCLGAVKAFELKVFLAEGQRGQQGESQ